MGHDTVVNYAHRFAPAAPDEEHVYGACAPGWHSAASHEDAVEDWISFMQEQGIRRVCSVVAGPDRPDEGSLARYRDAFGYENVCHAPIADGHLADADVLETEILPFLDESRDRDQKVVVHCLTGIGRTGQVLAAWLVAHRGYRPPEAIDTVRETGRDPREAVRRGNATLAELHDLLRQVS